MDFGIHGRSWSQSPMDTKGWLYYCWHWPTCEQGMTSSLSSFTIVLKQQLNVTVFVSVLELWMQPKKTASLDVWAPSSFWRLFCCCFLACLVWAFFFCFCFCCQEDFPGSGACPWRHPLAQAASGCRCYAFLLFSEVSHPWLRMAEGKREKGI